VKTHYELHDNVNDYHDRRQHSFSGNLNRLVPAIKIITGQKNIHPYLLAGAIIGFGGKLTDHMTVETWGTGSNNFDIDVKVEYTQGMSYGLHGSLGVDMMIDDKIGLFCELSYNYLNWSPDHGKVVTYLENGVDVTRQVPNNYKEINYKTDYTYNTAISPPYVGLRQGPKFYLPFSSIGAMIGIHIYIDKIGHIVIHK